MSTSVIVMRPDKQPAGFRQPLFAGSVSAGFPSPADDYIEGLDPEVISAATPCPVCGKPIIVPVGVWITLGEACLDCQEAHVLAERQCEPLVLGAYTVCPRCGHTVPIPLGEWARLGLPCPNCPA